VRGRVEKERLPGAIDGAVVPQDDVARKSASPDAFQASDTSLPVTVAARPLGLAGLVVRTSTSGNVGLLRSPAGLAATTRNALTPAESATPGKTKRAPVTVAEAAWTNAPDASRRSRTAVRPSGALAPERSTVSPSWTGVMKSNRRREDHGRGLRRGRGLMPLAIDDGEGVTVRAIGTPLSE